MDADSVKLKRISQQSNRGGCLIIEPSPEAEQDAGSRVTGTIVTVLYEEHVKQLKKMAGVW
jgi:hypothetical protein